MPCFFFKSALELSVCYLLIAHVPIWFVTKWQHLPHNNSKAPDITGWGKNPMSNGLWCCPSDGNLTTLWKSRDTEYPACIIELYFSSASMQEAYKVVQRQPSSLEVTHGHTWGNFSKKQKHSWKLNEFKLSVQLNATQDYCCGRKSLTPVTALFRMTPGNHWNFHWKGPVDVSTLNHWS